MPRASRYLRDGHIYHLTHRCHDRRFLLKFKRDRDVYRRWLREAARRYEVAVYGYCITGNHVHILVDADDARNVGLMMHLAAGAYAQQWNRRKQQEGSAWEHPYHCTIVQNGRHLWNCLTYISLNMVRAGVVCHPSEWAWSGHDELCGIRRRYRILDIERLCDRVEVASAAELQAQYCELLEDRLARKELEREPEWTGALAVGDRAFVETVSCEYATRRKWVYSEPPSEGRAWAVREADCAYDVI